MAACAPSLHIALTMPGFYTACWQYRVNWSFLCSFLPLTPRLPVQPTPKAQLMGMLPLVLMFVVLYFVMIRPQMKKAKEHKAMVEALAKGDEVIMVAGGMLGKIAKLGETYLSVEVANGVEVQMQRAARDPGTAQRHHQVSSCGP
jgi:preprotein translocase subunit YajC